MAIDLDDITDARSAFFHLRNAVMADHHDTNPANPETHGRFWGEIEPKALALLGTICEPSIDNMDDTQASLYLCALFSLIHNAADGGQIFPTYQHMWPDNYALLNACKAFLPAYLGHDE